MGTLSPTPGGAPPKKYDLIKGIINHYDPLNILKVGLDKVLISCLFWEKPGPLDRFPSFPSFCTTQLPTWHQWPKVHPQIRGGFGLASWPRHVANNVPWCCKITAVRGGRLKVAVLTHSIHTKEIYLRNVHVPYKNPRQRYHTWILPAYKMTSPKLKGILRI